MKTVHVCMGLPGSGKTYFCKGKNTLELDELTRLSFNEKTRTKKAIFDVIRDRLQKDNTNSVYIDGLFLDTAQIIEVLSVIFEVNPSFYVVIDKWEENREACLQNDATRQRRTKNSVSTILNASYTLDFSVLQERFPDKYIRVEEHKIVLASKFKIDAAMNGVILKEDRYLISSPWITGGRIGNYMNDDVDFIDPDPQPILFSELSSFLLEISPAITLEQYLDIMKNAVSIEQKEEHDYYNSVTNYAYYQADLVLIYEMLDL